MTPDDRDLFCFCFYFHLCLCSLRFDLPSTASRPRFNNGFLLACFLMVLMLARLGRLSGEFLRASLAAPYTS